MIEEAEAITLLLGLVALLVTLCKRRELRQLQASSLLLAAACFLLPGWVATILEGFAWTWGFDLLEHLCYASSSLLMVTWCWLLFSRRDEGRA